MLNDLTQKIAESVSEAIGHDVIFTDEKALIIGASDFSRKGKMHDASLRVIKTGKPNENDYFLKHRGNKQGITLPLEFGGKIIGTVGITGERKEVQKIAKLVKRQAELMLEENIYLKSSLLREQALAQFVQDVLISDHNNSNDIVLKARAYQLGYDFKLPYIVIAINLFKNNGKDISSEKIRDTAKNLYLQSLKQKVIYKIKGIFSKPNDLTVVLNEQKYIVLYSLSNKYNEKNISQILEKKCTQIIDEFQKQDIVAKIGIGSIAENISDMNRSYKEAWKSLELGKKVRNKSLIYNIEEFYLEDLISHMDRDQCKYFMDKTLKNLWNQSDYKELFKTVIAWFESGFSQSEAAKELYIHRNTFIHRLNKISELTGRNLKNSRNAHILYLAVLMEKIINEDSQKA